MYNATSKPSLDTRRHLSGARAGDGASWEGLLRRVDARLEVLARFRCAPHGVGTLQVDDLLQEVHLEMVRTLARFEYRGPGSLQRWAASILTNKLRNARRRGRRLPANATDLVPPGEAAKRANGLHEALLARSSTPSRVALDREAVARVSQTLAALRPELREAVLLRLYEGLSNHEAARRVGVSDSVLSERYHTALQACGRPLRDG
ncbi:MAG: sigma-70 family RNA polymerase sigma factor [Planctomycetota bacterium]